MAIRRTFDTPLSGDEEAPGQEWNDGNHWDENHFGGYGARSETVGTADGGTRQVIVGTSRGDYVNRYRGLGAAAANRQAYQLDYTGADQDRARGLQSREGQVQAAEQLRNAALGNAPSRAEIMSQGGLDAGMHAQLNASGKGLASAAYAQRQGMAQEQQGQLGAISESTGQRANELGSAQDAFTRGAGAIRYGDYASQNQAQQQQKQQMLIELEQRQRNQQQQQAYENLAFGVNKSEMDAEVAKRQGFLQRDAANQQAANARRAQGDDMVGTTVGAAGAAGAGLTRAGGGAGGGGGGGGTPPAPQGSWGDQTPGSTDDKWQRDSDTANSDMRGKEQVHMLSDDRTKLARAYQAGREHGTQQVSSGKAVDTPPEYATKLQEGRGAQNARRNAATAALVAPTPQVIYPEPPMTDRNRHRAVVDAQLATKRAAMGTPFERPIQADPVSRIADATADVVEPAYDVMPTPTAPLETSTGPGALRRAAMRLQASSDERVKGDVVALYEPPGKQLHIGDDGRARYASEQPETTGGASLSGIAPTYSKVRATDSAPAPSPVVAPTKKRMSNEEMLAEADRILAKGRAEHEQRMAQGPAVRDRGQGDIGQALEHGLAPYEYEYKPGFREQEGQEPGEKNVGPMAQNMAANPITGSAVKKGENGLLYIDMPKAQKLSLGGIGYLAQQQREHDERLRRLEKGRA